MGDDRDGPDPGYLWRMHMHPDTIRKWAICVCGRAIYDAAMYWNHDLWDGGDRGIQHGDGSYARPVDAERYTSRETNATSTRWQRRPGSVRSGSARRSSGRSGWPSGQQSTATWTRPRSSG